jgi:ABC-type transport system substrate-binding protein
MKTKTKIILISVALLAVLAVYCFPVNIAKAWYPAGGGVDDYKWELFGPHVKGITIPMYASEEAEWTAMDNNLLDLEDWALTKTWIDHWNADPRFTIADYGGENGYFILDINNNATLPDGSANPCAVVSMRQAIACLVNRTTIVTTICEGFALPMWTTIPTYMTAYLHPEIKPYGLLENLAYTAIGDATYWGNDSARAEAYLDADHFPRAGPGLDRYWDKNANGVKDAGEDYVVLKFYSRSDSGQRLLFGNDLNARLNSVGLRTDYMPRVRQVCSDNVMGAKDFHMYTGGWSGIGPDPDVLFDLYHGVNYWHPGKPPNYANINDPILNQKLEDIKFANTVEEAVAACLAAQERFAGIAASVPLWCASGYKVFRNQLIDAPGQNVEGVVNQKAFGANSFWTTLNEFKNTELYPNAYIKYGFKSDVEKLNPVYAEWYWDWEVLGRMYDGGASRNPYELSIYMPQLYKNWEAGTWVDKGETKSKVRITLKPNLYWQDGTPITIADVYYTLVEMSDELLGKGLPPPWWYPTVQYFKSVYIVDPYNIEILLDVKSTFAVGWVIGTIVLPKHIWKPIVDASSVGNPIVNGKQPDPLCIASGPFKFNSWSQVEPKRIVLDASTTYWQYCPVYVNVHNTPTYATKLIVDPVTKHGVFNFDVTIKNLWLNDSHGGFLTVNKYLYVDGVLQPTFPHNIDIVTLASGAIVPNIESFAYDWTAGKHNITVAVHVKGPAMLDEVHVNPWISQWINATQRYWVTIKEDIAGTTLHDQLGLPSYPYKATVPCPDLKVDIQDLARASGAFGSYPGLPNWNTVADITGDYKVDIQDLARVSSKFGWNAGA